MSAATVGAAEPQCAEREGFALTLIISSSPYCKNPILYTRQFDTSIRTAAYCLCHSVFGCRAPYSQMASLLGRDHTNCFLCKCAVRRAFCSIIAARSNIFCGPPNCQKRLPVSTMNHVSPSSSREVFEADTKTGSHDRRTRTCKRMLEMTWANMERGHQART